MTAQEHISRILSRNQGQAMTTITIERAVLLRALEALRPATAPNGAKRDAAFEELRAALAAPATAPEFPADWAQMIHYPECWDTAAYPELRYAIHEALAWSGCSVCKPATAPERKPMTPEQIETMWPSPEGTNSIHALVRAVEAFHGIKETP